MLKVKEFLDTNFKFKNTSLSELKPDGHYNIHGSWLYTIKKQRAIEYKDRNIGLLDNCIQCSINDETLTINIVFNGKPVGHYLYFYTYSEYERGNADKYGFFNRSTDNEIIHYIQSYMNIINQFK